MEHERRRALRFRLIAPAELVDENSGQRIAAYVTDVSLNGCTLGITHPPRKGKTIQLEIVTPNESFESRATVVYSHAHSAGLTFRDVKPQSLTVLQRWLVAARLEQQQREGAGEAS